MTGRTGRSGLTAGEVLVIVVVVGLLIAMLVPYLLRTRERSRREACQHRLQRIGLGLSEYLKAKQCFPSSSTQATLTADSPRPGSDNSDGNGSGFSWLIQIIPYTESQPLAHSEWDVSFPPDGMADILSGAPFDGSAEHLAAAARQLALFRCPSFSGPVFSSAPEYPPNSQALSNYVALGATHLASLHNTETLPIGGEEHPNGVIYPGSKTRSEAIPDGLANTLVACETIEQRYAAWFDGTTAAVAALAQEPPPTFRQDTSFPYEQVVYEPIPEVKAAINYGDPTANPPRYYLTTENHSGQEKWVHGPSSEHLGVVNHLLADGSVRNVSKHIDARLYMHMVTRAGAETP